jgi:hypothetical protein
VLPTALSQTSISTPAESMQKHPTPACKAAHARKAATARKAASLVSDFTHDDALLAECGNNPHQGRVHLTQLPWNGTYFSMT